MIWDDEWKSPLTSKNLSNCNAQGLVEKSPKMAILPSIWLSPLTRLKVVLPPGEHSLGHQQLTVWLIICQIALHSVWWLKSPSRGISGFQDRRSCRGASCLNMLVKKFDWLCHAPYLLHIGPQSWELFFIQIPPFKELHIGFEEEAESIRRRQ